jgi:DNA-binding CsgD family transcriptional regulator
VTGAKGCSPSVADGFDLAPRLRQTLELLVAGDSERQVALKLKISQHTVHVYVKQLYKRFGVNSRGELLARFIRGQS